MPLPAISSVDLNDLAVLEGISADDSEHDAEYGTDDSSDEDDALPEILPSDVLKHYWNKGNVKYTVSHAGRKYYLTAEAMNARFRGVPHTILKYWEGKRSSSISSFRIMEYFSIHGHIGPFREPLYRFLPRRIQRLWKEDPYNFFF
ncbi:hypothetical protein QFC21_006345 [Naganishia friedmannii]|nr:hypothetical protein QFC21_006345 [Naganishia friedmannii]